MNYDDIKRLEPRLGGFERSCFELARQLKRAGQYSESTFWDSNVRPRIRHLVGEESGRQSGDPLGTEEAYDIALGHFVDHEELWPGPTEPQIAIRVAADSAGIEYAVNDFLADHVCHLISCDVRYADGSFIATIIYNPYF